MLLNILMIVWFCCCYRSHLKQKFTNCGNLNWWLRFLFSSADYVKIKPKLMQTQNNWMCLILCLPTLSNHNGTKPIQGVNANHINMLRSPQKFWPLFWVDARHLYKSSSQKTFLIKYQTSQLIAGGKTSIRYFCKILRWNKQEKLK